VTSRGLAWTLGALVALAYASVLFGGQTFADASWLGQVAPVPGGLDPTQLDQAYIDQITPTYAGPIVVAADQMML
jgi:hypothetical protein